MQYMRESDPVGVIFAGAQNRPAEELVTALRKVGTSAAVVNPQGSC